jgi:hypothetical protein
MADYPADAFTFYANFNKDKKTEGAYWSSIEMPVDELRKLFVWAKNTEKTENFQGKECVKVRGSLRPKTSQNGNDYLMLILSDEKARKDDSVDNGTDIF